MSWEWSKFRFFPPNSEWLGGLVNTTDFLCSLLQLCFWSSFTKVDQPSTFLQLLWLNNGIKPCYHNKCLFNTCALLHFILSIIIFFILVSVSVTADMKILLISISRYAFFCIEIGLKEIMNVGNFNENYSHILAANAIMCCLPRTCWLILWLLVK